MTLDVEAAVVARDFDARLHVPQGATVAVLGPNGAGKSTMLGVAAGLVRPDSGRVRVGDRELTRIAAPGGRDRVVAPHRRRTALLGQDPLLFPHLSALDNVAFAPRSRGRGRREARAVAHDLLQEVGVGELTGRRPRELSGGQAQRVAVARALAAEPEVLLLDEPMAALDVDVAPALRQTLRRILAGRTTVLVTHDVLDAVILADSVVVLEAGRVVEEGATEEVLARPRSAFAARLAGLNLVRGRWRGDHLEGSGGEVVRGLASGSIAAGAAAVATFRPSAVAVYRETPAGSPRNRIPVTVTALEPAGEVVRVRAGDLAADLTPASVRELELAPGAAVTFTVKATEVAVHPVGRT